MNILQIGTLDIVGGAARVSYDLHRTYRSSGHNSKMLVKTKYSDDPDVIEILSVVAKRNRVLAAKIDGLTNTLEETYGIQYLSKTGARALLQLDIVKNSDVIHLHNTHGSYLNLFAIKGLSARKPVIWTLHDMWSITGHCAHSLDCEKWRTGCGECEALDRYPGISRDTTRFLWKLKHWIYSQSNFVLSVPSLWLKNKLPDSILSHVPVHLINNAVDTTIFRPQDRREVRAKLDLPDDRFILTFIADGIDNPWKGFNYLAEALTALRQAGTVHPYLVVIGNRSEFVLEQIGLEGRCIGMISDPQVIADYNAASNGYLCPSIAENSPLVVLEAMACGTPVVAFEVGGVPEVVSHKKNGYIASYRDSIDLRRGIEWLLNLDRPEYDAVSQQCVVTIEGGYTLSQQAEQFLNLYEKLRG